MDSSTTCLRLAFILAARVVRIPMRNLMEKIKLEFGNKEQIKALKEAAEKAPFCPRCNALGVEYWDEVCGDYAECESCRILWWKEKGRVKIEEL